MWLCCTHVWLWCTCVAWEHHACAALLPALCVVLPEGSLFYYTEKYNSQWVITLGVNIGKANSSLHIRYIHTYSAHFKKVSLHKSAHLSV